MATQHGGFQGGHVATGTGTGTGAAIDIDLGFKPSFVQWFNTEGNCQGVWAAPMADASLQKIVDSGTSTTDISAVTTNGITPTDSGFTMGADTDLNVSGEDYAFFAIG